MAVFVSVAGVDVGVNEFVEYKLNAAEVLSRATFIDAAVDALVTLAAAQMTQLWRLELGHDAVGFEL